MIFEKKDYTPSAAKVLSRAIDIAYNFDYQVIGTEHVLAALASVPDTLVEPYLQKNAIEYDEIADQISEFSSKNIFNKADLEFSPRLKKTLAYAQELSLHNSHKTVGTEYLFVAILSEDNSFALQILDNLHVNMNHLYRQIVQDNDILIPSKRKARAVTPMSQTHRAVKVDKDSKTPTLDSVATDMTKMAREGAYDPVISRTAEIERIIQVLARRTKNNPVLVGEPGVGKTAIVEGLAERIATGDIPLSLENVRIMSLSMATVIAGTSLRGEFEDRMVAIVEEVKKTSNVIVFIDELHSIMGAGGGQDSPTDASNILKPALARGDFQMIGATTYKEYQKYIEKDEALERRLARILVDEPTEAEALEILRGVKNKFEDFHEVAIGDEVLTKIVELAGRYIPSRRFPDKALDILDETCARVKVAEKNNLSKTVRLQKELNDLKVELPEAVENLDIKKAKSIQKDINGLINEIDKTQKASVNRKSVSLDDVYAVMSTLSGIPIQEMTKTETERLLNLEQELHKRVIGQNEAVESVARAIRRSRSGVADSHRPMGSFMFLGPTGVGKTELVKALAASVFGSEDNLIRVDMSEYMEKFSTSRLLGAPPGYVGYDEGGQLTEQVRNKPYSVILLDEVEKAHPDVFNIMLQILDEGFVTDSKGRKVNFRNTIIIMTSNLGATALRNDKQVGFSAVDWSQDYEAMKKRILEELKQTYRPEFLNRIDETIVFHSLTEKELQEIVKLMTRSLIDRLAKRGISLKVTAAATKNLAKVGFDPEYGARPLRKVIERQLEDRLSEKILQKEIGPSAAVIVGVSGNELSFKVET